MLHAQMILVKLSGVAQASNARFISQLVKYSVTHLVIWIVEAVQLMRNVQDVQCVRAPCPPIVKCTPSKHPQLCSYDVLQYC